MVDEVADLTTVEHVALCCRYVNCDGEIKTSFLSDTPIHSATADNLTNTIKIEVENSGLDMKKMTGFAFDGAAVFAGRKNGVAKQLRDMNSKMVTNHCSDHRLALACREF